MNRTHPERGIRHSSGQDGERLVEAYYAVLTVLVIAMIVMVFVTASGLLQGSHLPPNHRHATKDESHTYAFPLQ